MDQYKDLVDAAKLVAKAKAEVGKEDGDVMSPAWTFLRHSLNYLTNEAEVAFRGE